MFRNNILPVAPVTAPEFSLMTLFRTPERSRASREKGLCMLLGSGHRHVVLKVRPVSYCACLCVSIRVIQRLPDAPRTPARQHHLASPPTARSLTSHPSPIPSSPRLPLLLISTPRHLYRAMVCRLRYLSPSNISFPYV